MPATPRPPRLAARKEPEAQVVTHLSVLVHPFHMPFYQPHAGGFGLFAPGGFDRKAQLPAGDLIRQSAAMMRGYQKEVDRVAKRPGAVMAIAHLQTGRWLPSDRWKAGLMEEGFSEADAGRLLAHGNGQLVTLLAYARQKLGARLVEVSHLNGVENDLLAEIIGIAFERSGRVLASKARVRTYGEFDELCAKDVTDGLRRSPTFAHAKQLHSKSTPMFAMFSKNELDAGGNPPRRPY